MKDEKDKGSNETAAELIVGIGICGIVFQASGMWFFADKLYFTVGLWIGVLICVALALHMNYSIRAALEMPKEHAAAYYRRMYSIRTVIFIVLFIGTIALGIGSAAALFLGLLSMKFGAYLQPVLHRLRKKRKRKGG